MVRVDPPALHFATGGISLVLGFLVAPGFPRFGAGVIITGVAVLVLAGELEPARPHVTTNRDAWSARIMGAFLAGPGMTGVICTLIEPMGGLPASLVTLSLGAALMWWGRTWR